MNGHTKVCQVLSDAGGDWKAVNNVLQTPRDVGHAYQEIVNMLPERIRDERLLSQAEEFARLKQRNIGMYVAANNFQFICHVLSLY